MKPRADSRAARGIWAAVGGEKGAACVIVGGGAILGFFCFFGKGGGGGGVEVEKDGERGLSKKKKTSTTLDAFSSRLAVSPALLSSATRA